jgi:hypothetical protein
MPAREESEENNMLVRFGNAGDVADGRMGVDDVARTNVNVSPRTGPAAGSRPSGPGRRYSPARRSVTHVSSAAGVAGSDVRRSTVRKVGPSSTRRVAIAVVLIATPLGAADREKRRAPDRIQAAGMP